MFADPVLVRLIASFGQQREYNFFTLVSDAPARYQVDDIPGTRFTSMT
jgi:hypothetical protein